MLIKVIGTDTGRSAAYDLLLRFDNNHGPISYRFWDKRRFPSKIAKFSYPGVFCDPLNGIGARDQKTERPIIPGTGHCRKGAHSQWRRSVITFEGSGSVRSSHQTSSPPKFVFIFGAENGLFGNFRFFCCFRPKMNFHYRFIFRFCSKNVICGGPKMLRSQLNRN